jgi:hypothetical protein
MIITGSRVGGGGRFLCKRSKRGSKGGGGYVAQNVSFRRDTNKMRKSWRMSKGIYHYQQKGQSRRKSMVARCLHWHPRGYFHRQYRLGAGSLVLEAIVVSIRDTSLHHLRPIE